MADENNNDDGDKAGDLLGGEIDDGNKAGDGSGGGSGDDGTGSSGSNDGGFDFKAAVAQLPDDLKGNEALGKFESFEDLAKAALSAGSMSAPEGYKDLNFEGVTSSDEEAKAWSGVFKEANISQASAEKLLEATRALSKDSADKAVAAGTESLKKEHGGNFDQVIKDAKSAMAHFGGAELQEAILQSGFGSDPRLINAFAKMKSLMSEDTMHGTGGGNTGLSKEAAQEKLAELKMDKDFMKAYRMANEPGHKEAVEKMEKLHKILASA